MHRKKAISILFVLPPPAFQSLEQVLMLHRTKASRPAAGLMAVARKTYPELEDAAIAAEKKERYGKAAALMSDALQSRINLSSDAKSSVLPTQRRLAQHILTALYSWAFRFIREGHSDHAFAVLKVLDALTKGACRKAWRNKVIQLLAWYYSRVGKFHAAMDYIDLCRQMPRTDATAVDSIVTQLLTGYILSSVSNFRDAVSEHGAAHAQLAALPAGEVDEKALHICLAVCLFNLAADYKNLFQTKEAEKFIQSAHQLATACLPVGSFTREKIRMLHSELFAASAVPSIPLRSSRGGSITQRRQSDSMSSQDTVRKVPVLASVRRHRSPARQTLDETKDTARPTSAIASKSVSQHRRRKRYKSGNNYSMMEQLLRDACEPRATTPELQRLPLTERPSDCRGRNLHFVQKHKYEDIVKALKVKVSRKAVAATRKLLRSAHICDRRVIRSALYKICAAALKREQAAVIIQRHVRGFLSRLHTASRLVASFTFRRLICRFLLDSLCRALYTGRLQLAAVSRWEKLTTVFLRRCYQCIARELKAVGNSHAPSTEACTSRTDASQEEASRRTAQEAWKEAHRKEAQRTAAVVLLQRYARGWIARRQLQSLVQVVKFLQTQLRAWSLRRKTAAARIIQRFYRGFFARRTVATQRRSAIVIQSHARRFLVQRRLKRKAVAARRIQRLFRRGVVTLE